EANESGIIISDPNVGCIKFGLTEKGRTQALAAASNLRSFLEANTTSTIVELHIVSSDFLRASETASIVTDHFKGNSFLSDQRQIKVSLKLEPRLRERFFGDHEGLSNVNYDGVWSLDSEEICRDNCESPVEVLKRALEVIKLEKESFASATDHNIVSVLVSHGDTLQMIQSFFNGGSPWKHRSVPHLETAELRKIF
ncbi:hypothetical protein HK096_007619, partial [Nowakowskiella sp. JEL0078]